MTGTFAAGVAAYAEAGWPCILPVPPETKSPPPVGFTGAEGADTEPVQLVQWAGSHADWSIALRLGDGVIGIDVDHYVKGNVTKRGGDTLAALEAQLGALPPTWTSSAREAPSGIRFYRVPPGRYRTKLQATHPDGTVTGDIEVIQRHHRYAVVWPSVHEIGGTYAWWYGDSAERAERGPAVPWLSELTEAPEPWVEFLREGATEAGPPAADRGSGRSLLDQLETDDRPMCAEMYDAVDRAAAELAKADEGTRHDMMAERVHRIVHAGAAGHPGAGPAIAAMRERWSSLTASENRGEEFERALLGSARKAVTSVGVGQVVVDPCTLIGTITVSAPAPIGLGGDADPDPEPIDPDVVWNVRGLIGVHAFDPRANTDQTLAEAVLERMYPAVRYAADAGTWLRRGPFVWEPRRDLANWSVAQVAWFMPHGDPEADKGSPELERAARRKRFMDHTQSNKIAGKIRALVASDHPMSIKLAELDAEREILWAGGLPYDLRASLDGPVRSLAVHPAVPHLHSAGVAPDVRPTPLWDAFCSAVWPDPEVRAWVLRVLSICLTGYADRALPILVGETGRGKTQVVALLMSLLGSYAHTADSALLSTDSKKQHTTIKYDLKGRRLSFIDEAPGAGKAATEALKEITGGGNLTGRQMNQDPVTFRPTHTLVLTANDEPGLTDPAVRSRVRFIPCDGDPEAVRLARAALGDVNGPAWRKEAPGVLAALMREAAAWLVDPSTTLTEAAPASIRFRAEEIAAEQDVIRTWLDEETEADEEGSRSRVLFQAFVSWCRESNTPHWAIPTETKWGRDLNRLGYPSEHRRTGKHRKLRLRLGGGGNWTVPTPGVWAPAPETVTGNGSRDGAVSGLKTDPSQPETPGQTLFSNPSVNSVTGYTPSTTHKEGKKAPIRRQGQTGVEPNTSGPTKPALTSEFSGVTGTSEPVTQAPQGSRTARKTAKAAERKAAKAAEKAAARQAKVDEAAGPAVQLPAVVNRSGSITPVSHDEARTVLDLVLVAEHGLTVDVEHTGYPIGHKHYALRTVQLGGADLAVDLDASDPNQLAIARDAIAAAPVLRAHSAVADLVPLDVAGVVDADEAWSRMHDTVIPAKLSDPASTGSDPDLKGLARNMLGPAAVAPAADVARGELFKAAGWLTDVDSTTAPERSGWAQVDPQCSTMVRYAASDVLDTAGLAKVLPMPTAEAYERERTAQRVTARVSHRGVKLDGDRVHELIDQHRAKRAEITEKIQGTYGIENPGSGQQVAAKLTSMGMHLPRTKPSRTHPDGQPSAAKDAIAPYKRDDTEVGAFVRDVLDYRHHATLLGLILEPYGQLVDNGDGRARPTIYTLAADTGRMSCVRPNLQQVPREGGVRSCVIADEGLLIVRADFASVEVREFAALSGDEQLKSMLDAGLDVHAEAARIVFGPDFTKADRYDVKRGVFGWLYGGALETIARQMGASLERAQVLMDTLARMAPQGVAWLNEVKQLVRAGQTQLPTPGGRIIHLPRQFPHKAANYCIQGSARELLVDSLIRWSGTRWGNATLLPIHDEVIAFVPAEEAEEATAALVACMETEHNGVRIVADPSAPAAVWLDAA